MTSSDPPLLCLPPEVTDKVTDNLEDDEDLLALAITCHPFAERYYLPAVASRLGKAYHGPDPEEADEEKDSDSPRLFCLSNTVDGELGFSPFFISSAVLSPDRTKIAVGITSPAFNELRDDAPTSSYIFVDTSDREGVARMSRWYQTPCVEVGDGLFLRRDTDRAYWRDDEREKRLARAPVTRDLEVKTATVDWRETLAGRLLPATVELLEERLDCPECRGVHKVTITENTLRHWPELRRLLRRRIGVSRRLDESILEIIQVDVQREAVLREVGVPFFAAIISSFPRFPYCTSSSLISLDSPPHSLSNDNWRAND